MKYIDCKVVFKEIPDEVSLAFNISGCPVKCKNCHSKYLWSDTGVELNWSSIVNSIEVNKEVITCVAFMGGDSNPEIINDFAKRIKEVYPYMKIGWYSGRKKIHSVIDLNNFNYIKVGPYIEDNGGLDCPTTNQKMYEVNHYTKSGKPELIDITDKFWNND